MKSAQFQFYDGLNHFLPPFRKKVNFSYSFRENQTVKHLIEALGVPHTEVEHILANEKPVGFSYQVQDGDRIEVFPYRMAEGNNAKPGHWNGQEPRFLLDIHLGRLARYLRMLGFDAKYRNDYEDDELAQIANQENRILLTRDRRLLMRNLVTQGYCLRDLNPKKQILEILHRFQLSGEIQPFKRCIRCNTPLESVEKEAILDQLEPLTRRYFNEFRICPRCGQIYWKGSHYDRMVRLIQQLLEAGVKKSQ